MVAVAEHIKVPELRFPEFSGEWEEKRLGEIRRLRITKSAMHYCATVRSSPDDGLDGCELGWLKNMVPRHKSICKVLQMEIVH